MKEIKKLLIYRDPRPEGSDYRRGYKAGWKRANVNADKILKLVNKLEINL